MSAPSSLIDRLCDAFEESLNSGERPSLSPILEQVGSSYRVRLLRELLALESELLPAEEFAERLEAHRAALPEYASVFGELTLVAEEVATEVRHTPSESRQSRQIGPYKILQVIGEGGMGSVYLAQQEHPVRRRVALKVIKAGLDSHQVIARFEAERQALAMMDHPSIARILDAGTTESGQPWFAMEWVKGIPLTDYCDQRKLSVSERLGLFRQICDAVQHAHQKGIIHRDLKPGNILVTEYEGKPIPKVIDFGLAKALEVSNKLTDKTMFTEFGQVIGTLKYMSPEQAGLDALDIDTRSDIYTLGVILYELLTGSTPLDASSFREQAILQVLELVREQEPPRPSSRLTTEKESLATVTERRQVDPRKLAQMLAGDLDWIVMKALEKDRNRRYDSAASFGADISHFLEDEPVTARPPSTTYRLRKFVKKNRGLVTAATTIVLLLVAGIVGTSIGFWNARTSRQSAQESATRSRHVLDIISRAFKSADPTEGGTNQMSAADILNNVRREMEETEIDSAGKAILLETLTSVFMGLGKFDTALETGEEGYVIARRLFGPEHPDTFNIAANIAICYAEIGKPEKAIEIEEELLEQMLASLGESNRLSMRVMQNLAAHYSQGNQAKQGFDLNKHLMELALSEFGPDSPQAIDAMAGMALRYYQRGETQKAIDCLSQVIVHREQHRGVTHPLTIDSKNNLAVALQSKKRYAESVKLFKECLEVQNKILDVNHPDKLRTMHNLARGLEGLGEFNESMEIREEVFERRKSKLGLAHSETVISATHFGRSLNRARQYSKWLQLNEEVSEACRREYGAGDLRTVNIKINLGASYIATRKFDSAIQTFAELLKVLEARDDEPVQTENVKKGLNMALNRANSRTTSWIVEGRFGEAKKSLSLIRQYSMQKRRDLYSLITKQQIANLITQDFGVIPDNDFSDYFAQSGSGDADVAATTAEMMVNEAYRLFHVDNPKLSYELAKRAASSTDISSFDRKRCELLLATDGFGSSKKSGVNETLLKHYEELSSEMPKESKVKRWLLLAAVDIVLRHLEDSGLDEARKKWSLERESAKQNIMQLNQKSDASALDE